MARVLGISGSLRKNSYNAALLRAAAAAAPAGLEVRIASIRGIPLYDADVDREEGPPAPVVELKKLMTESDGLLLVTPEYNGSIPGVFKNALDWISRPARDISRVFGEKPAAVMGATTGRSGTRLAQTAWLPVLRILGMRIWSGKQLYVAGAAEVFDDQGNLVDEKIQAALSGFMEGFAKFVGP